MLLSQDEARFPMVPTLTATLGVKGHRPVVGTRDNKHLRDVAEAYPADRHPRVVLVIDNAPWHRGRVIDEALAENPHLEFYRLPSYSPCLNPVEQFWRKLRRRATHNRLFDAPADLKRSVRNSLCYFQTVRERVATLVRGCYPTPQNPTGSANS